MNPTTSSATHPADKRDSPILSSSKTNRITIAQNQCEKNTSILQPPDAFHFVKKAKDRQAIIESYRQGAAGENLFIIRHPDDIDFHSLRQRTICHSPGLVQKEQGLIYTDQPITLIFDCDALSTNQIASLNELLETPAKLNGHPISTSVTRVVIAHESLIKNDHGPEADFWRRVFELNRHGQQSIANDPSVMDSQLDSTLKTDEELLNESLVHVDHPPPHSLTVNCLSKDAFSTLFGGLRLNRQGQIYFQPGLITQYCGQFSRAPSLWDKACAIIAGIYRKSGAAQIWQKVPHNATASVITAQKMSEVLITDEGGPSTVCLIDPPEATSRFSLQLADILRQGYFMANDKKIPLPRGLILQQSHTPADAIRQFKAKAGKNVFNPCGRPGFINTHNLASLLTDTVINQGPIQQTDTLAKLAGDCDQLVITSELTDRQWLTLKHRTDALPKPCQLINGIERLPSENRVTLALYDPARELPAVEQGACHYPMAAGADREALWFKTRLQVSDVLIASQVETELLTHLRSGQPVVLTGLENSPFLAGQLETLLAPVPYLWVFGQRIDLPNACIKVLWPSDQPATEGLWRYRCEQARQPVKTEQPCGFSQLAMAHSDREVNQLKVLLGKLSALPVSADKSYPKLPIQNLPHFLELLTSQVNTERVTDQSLTFCPWHWRKALNKLLAHPARGSRKVYSYLKAQINCIFSDKLLKMAEVDRAGLLSALEQTPLRNVDDMSTRFWELARFMTAALRGHLPDAIDKKPTLKALAKMATVLRNTLPESQTGCLADYPVSSTPVPIQPCHGNQRRLLYDALLAAGDHRLQKDKPIHRQVLELEQELLELEMKIKASAQEHKQKCKNEEVTIDTLLKSQILRELGQWLTESLPENKFSDLAEDWLAGGVVNINRHGKRLSQILAMLDDQKIVELNGPAGSGKSWLAQAVGMQLTGRGPLTLSLGPHTRWEDLYGETVMSKDSEGNPSIQCIPGPLLTWAQSHNPPLLVLDEANLAPPGLLSPLAGLREAPPTLCIDGQVISLTDQHTLILTGNPESYPGRALEPELQKRVARLYYRPIPHPLLAQCVIKPQLPAAWPEPLKSQATANILSVFSEYQPLLPGYELTPRDLNDVLARLRAITGYSSTLPLNKQQMMGVVVEAFRQSLGSAIPKHKQEKWLLLHQYWQSMGKLDDSLLQGQQDAFNAFFDQLRIDNQHDPQPLVLDTTAPRQYVQSCWQFLQLDSGGRRGMLVEGPAGWGKDVLFRRVLKTWTKQHTDDINYVHLNAAPDQTDTFCQQLNCAAGRPKTIMMVSELNLLPGQYMDGVLSDVLTTPQAADFKFITTINPPSYSGRNRLSPALESRFTQVRITGDVTEDYRARLTALGIQDDLIQWLIANVKAINQACTQSRLQLELTLPDLIRVASELQQKDASRWIMHLTHRWQPYLKACDLLKLPVMEVNSQQPTIPNATTVHGERKTFNPTINPDDTEVTFGSDVQTMVHYDVIRYFPMHPYDDTAYRMKLTETIFNQQKGLMTRPVTWEKGKLVPIAANEQMSWRARLQPDELPGKIKLPLTDQWQALPSLTPEDQLRGLKTEPAVPGMALTRSQLTGQILIRSESSKTQNVTIDFIISPSQAYFTPVTEGEPVQLQPDLIHPLLKTVLDREIFSQQQTSHPACQALQNISKAPDPAGKLLELVKWIDTFADNKTFEDTGVQLLIRLLKEKQGTCRHKSMLFQVLCHYWGIPARQAHNTQHIFAEVSLDGSNHWRSFQISGGGRSSTTTTEPDWQEYQRSAPEKQWQHGTTPQFQSNRFSENQRALLVTAQNPLVDSASTPPQPSASEGWVYEYTVLPVNNEPLPLLGRTAATSLQRGDNRLIMQRKYEHPEITEIRALFHQLTEKVQQLFLALTTSKVEDPSEATKRAFLADEATSEGLTEELQLSSSTKPLCFLSQHQEVSEEMFIDIQQRVSEITTRDITFPFSDPDTCLHMVLTDGDGYGHRYNVFEIFTVLFPKICYKSAEHSIHNFDNSDHRDQLSIIAWCWFAIANAMDRPDPFLKWAALACELLKSKLFFPHNINLTEILNTIIKQNLDRNGSAQEIMDKTFSTDNMILKKLAPLSQHEISKIEKSSNRMPEITSYIQKASGFEESWSWTSGRLAINRLINFQPPFLKNTIVSKRATTVILSSDFLIDKAGVALLNCKSISTGNYFGDLVRANRDSEKGYTTPKDVIDAEITLEDITRIMGTELEKRKAIDYEPVIYSDFKNYRILIIGNSEDNKIIVYESPKGQNFNLMSSRLMSTGISLNNKVSLEKVKLMLNEHNAVIVV